jgi:VacB/RNase II family 3'-5' exoribonuclease
MSDRNAHPNAGANALRAIARRAMIERSLVPDFSPGAMKQLAALSRPASVLGATSEGVRDMRDMLWASIDNDDSRDLDQLSVSSPRADGAVSIFVAIADVDALVKKGTPIDAHAQANTTSVYTSAQIFPMLPEKLSTDLTSLADGQDRRAIVVEMTVHSDGSVAQSAVYEAAVRNRAKLAYNSVAAWLDGTGPMPAPVAATPGMDEQLRIQDRVAAQLRKRRFEHGALSLETLEARAVFEHDTLSDLVPEGRNRAKDLIEDFMIAANTATAMFLDGKGFPTVRRVLRSPERWAKLVAMAESYGDKLPAEPSNEALSGFLTRRRAADPARFSDLSVSVVKLLGRGEYVLDPPGRKVGGHFGLALRDYTHSTAPNRRFPDLLSQRLVKAALGGHAPPYSIAELDGLAKHCTLQEDNAAKVERRVRKSAAAYLLAHRIGERFDAIVTGASPKGTYVRIAHPAAEGKVVRGAEGLDVGDHVRVELLATDYERGFVDFGRSR